MKVLIFSDSHLGSIFEAKKFNFLKRIIESADKVIINGDFWDRYYTDFDGFLISKWQSLFPLLKDKQTIYIYGNHDLREFSDKRVESFCDEAIERYSFESGNTTFICFHGNQIAPSSDDKYPIVRKFINSKPVRTLARIHLEQDLRKAEKKGWFSEFNAKDENDPFREWADRELLSNQYLVTGHTHCGEIDHTHRYINSGFVNNGLAQYVMIEDGNITLKNEKY